MSAHLVILKYHRFTGISWNIKWILDSGGFKNQQSSRAQSGVTSFKTTVGPYETGGKHMENTNFETCNNRIQTSLLPYNRQHHSFQLLYRNK